jgi:pimeloyl-ACP methyl ester carboxylesterase
MRGYARTSGGQIHFRAEGESGPAAFFLHESPLSSAIYAPALPYLGKSFRAYAFDSPGYGMSDRPPEGASVEDYASLVLEAIDDLGVDRFIVVGCHTGASIGIELTKQAGPERISHVVLMGVTMNKPDEWEPWLASRVFSADRPRPQHADGTPFTAKETFAPEFEIKPDGSHMKWAWDRTAVGRKDWPEGSPLELVNMAVMQLLVAGKSYPWGYRAVWRYDAEPQLRALQCPVLLLNAAEDPLAHLDPVVAEIVPNARVVHFEGLAGQIPSREPERYAEEIRKFVAANPN